MLSNKTVTGYTEFINFLNTLEGIEIETVGSYVSNTGMYCNAKKMWNLPENTKFLLSASGGFKDGEILVIFYDIEKHFIYCRDRANKISFNKAGTIEAFPFLYFEIDNMGYLFPVQNMSTTAVNKIWTLEPFNVTTSANAFATSPTVFAFTTSVTLYTNIAYRYLLNQMSNTEVDLSPFYIGDCRIPNIYVVLKGIPQIGMDVIYEGEKYRCIQDYILYKVD